MNKGVLLVGSALIAISVFLPMTVVTRSPPELLDPSLYPNVFVNQVGGINTAMFLTMGGVFAALPFIMLTVCAWGAISTMTGASGKVLNATFRVGFLAVIVETVAYINMTSYDRKIGSPTEWMNQTGLPAAGAYLAYGASLGLIAWALFLHSSLGRRPTAPEGLLSATHSGAAAAAPASRLPAYGTPPYGSRPPAATTASMPLLPALPSVPVMPATPTLPLLPAPPTLPATTATPTYAVMPGPPTLSATPVPTVAVANQAPPGWYPDSYDPRFQRYFDGMIWTAHIAPR